VSLAREYARYECLLPLRLLRCCRRHMYVCVPFLEGIPSQPSYSRVKVLGAHQDRSKRASAVERCYQLTIKRFPDWVQGARHCKDVGESLTPQPWLSLKLTSPGEDASSCSCSGCSRSGWYVLDRGEDGAHDN